MTETGTYVLLLHLPDNEQLTIGKLGTFDFPAGWYAYVGSAFGPGGVGYIRLSFANSDEMLAEAVVRIGRFVKGL